jgi:tetratricopeptide (TPR) repeat protein
MDALKRRYEQRIETATQIQTQKYVTEADDALARNDVVAASSSLRIAVRFAPEDAALAARAAKVKKLADAVLSESYLKQAEYEERALQWDDAAKSWANVAKIRDDAVSHERAAHAMLRSSSPDLRVAADHAKRAITLDPSRIEHHVTLAEIYLEAGLRASARRSADAAAQLDAKHAGLQAFLKKLEKA